MPIVTIQLNPGRSLQQKRALVEAVTEAVVSTVGATRARLNVTLIEVPEENWGLGGELLADRGRSTNDVR